MGKNLKNTGKTSTVSLKKRFSETKCSKFLAKLSASLKKTNIELKALIKLQLSEKLKWKNGASVGYKVGTIAKRIGYMGVAYGCFVGLLFVIFKFLNVLPSRNIFIFLIAVLQILSLISCISDGSKTLYTSKDNALLLTYPVKHSKIFISKILVLYIIEFLKSITLTFPLMMAYGTVVKGTMSAGFVSSAISFSIFLPLIPVLLGAIISIPVVFISNLLKKIPIIKVFLTLGLIVGLIILTDVIVKSIEAIAPIRVVALYDEFNNGLQNFTGTFNKYVLYVNFIGRAMLPIDRSDVIIGHLAMVGILVTLPIVAIFLAMPTFFKLASSTTENATSKKHKGTNKAHSNTFITFIRKEFTMSVRNISNFISDYVFLFALPFVLVILGVIFINIDRNDFGISTSYGIIGLIALMLLAASNTASATSISSEGSEFVLIKTAPGKTSNIIWSKLLINWLVSFIMCTISFGVLLFFFRSAIQKGTVEVSKILIVYLYVNFVNLGLLFWSIQLDIVNPKLREFANSQNKNEIANAAQSITIGLIFSVIFSALLIGVFILLKNTALILLILLGSSILFAGLRFFFLIKYRDTHFEDIQL